MLGAAYLSLQAHQRIRAQQAETLRAQAYILNSLSYVPASAPKPKTIAEELALLEYQQELLAAAEQKRRRRQDEHDASFLQRAKDRWNTEIEGVVRWATTTDWALAREDAEIAVANVWARATGREPRARFPEYAIEVVNERMVAARRQSREEAAARVGDVARLKADEVKDTAGSIWERGFRRSKEAVGKAKAAVGLAEDEVAGAVNSASAQSEAEKVIQQRYERKPEDVLKRTAEEVLADRYKPIGQ